LEKLPHVAKKDTVAFGTWKSRRGEAPSGDLPPQFLYGYTREACGGIKRDKCFVVHIELHPPYANLKALRQGREMLGISASNRLRHDPSPIVDYAINNWSAK
jgi:hypothetical protein